jgi:hypothetical protein
MGFHHYRRADQPTFDWPGIAAGYAAQLKKLPKRRQQLADSLGLPLSSLKALPGLGWMDHWSEKNATSCGAWTFPEVDARGRVIGITRRLIEAFEGNTKYQMKGGGRGLTVPAGWFEDEKPKTGTVYVVEGASDVLAWTVCGLLVVGRPNNTGGAELLGELLERHPALRIVVMGENDQRPDERPGAKPGAIRWPGQEGVERVSADLANLLKRPVYTAFPPDGTKDGREWVKEEAAGAAQSIDWLAIGATIRTHADQVAVEVRPTATLYSTPIAVKGETGLIEPDLDVSSSPWPDPLHSDAMHGLAGELVSEIAPETEADPVAILFQFLTGFGNIVGRYSYYQIGKARHYPNLFAVLVGKSARARKGTSWAWARWLLSRAGDEQWADKRIMGGVASGEALIWEVRDPVMKRSRDKDSGSVEEKETDPGIEDKRLLVVEEEFAKLLHMGGREGSTLGDVLREAWDGGNLANRSKVNPSTATGAHISIISHITQMELIETMRSTQAYNGFCNRFLWAAIKRAQLLPFGGADISDLPQTARLRAAIHSASYCHRRMQMTDSALSLWGREYERLSSDIPGILGAVTTRAEPQVLRLALIYALLDDAPEIDVCHLRAAYAIQEYVHQSCRYIFGADLGNETADEIRRVLDCNPQGATQTQLYQYIKKNKSAKELETALKLLKSSGLARESVAAAGPKGGRPVTTWFSCKEPTKPGATS